MKLLVPIFYTLILLFISCNAGNSEKEATTSTEIKIITVDELLSNADVYANKPVKIKGTVTHVCRHGGQRLFIIGNDPNQRLKITTGPKISEFEVELEGSEVAVSGTLDEERIDENYLNTWEQEVMEKPEDEHTEGMGVHDGNHVSNNQEELDKINNFREKIKVSEKGYLSFYSISCDSLKEL